MAKRIAERSQIKLQFQKSLKNSIWKWRGVAIAAPAISLLTIALRLFGALESSELAMFDQFLRWRSPEPTDQRIVIIGIDEQDVNDYGWPIDDRLLTQLLDKVRQQKPRVIGLDLARNLPVGQGYPQLEKLFKSTPNLIGAIKLADLVDSNFAIASSGIAPPPALAELGQVGAVNLVLDTDGRVRRGLLALQLPNGDSAIGFGLQIALLYLDQEPSIPFEQEALNPTRWGQNDGGYNRADVGGHQFLINYRRSEKGFTILRMADVLENRIAPDLLRDRVVMVGATAVSLRDWFFTPLDGGINSTRVFTSGVEVHAQIVSHILSTSLDGRPRLQSWDEPWEWLWIFGWSLIGSFVVWQWRNVLTKDREIQVFLVRSLSILTIAGTLFAACFIALSYGWWLPFVPAAIAFLGGGAIVTSYLAITAAQVRTYFSRYLTDAVVKSLLETPEGLKLGGDRRQVTILMCDLRGFSSISEKMPPEQVVEILNVFLGTMTEAIAPYAGTIDEFIGDAILVIFGAPIVREDDAARAVASAIAMQLAMRSVNQELTKMGLPEIAMGIGINTGEVVAGNIGSQSRAKYAVVGNHVNLTARIESYTVGGQILISENTYAEVQSLVKVNGKMEVEPKGVSHPISIYDICAIGGKYQLHLPSLSKTLQILSQPLAIAYRVLEEKHLGVESFAGEILRLSPYGAEILTEQDLPVLSNLKVYLQIPAHYQLNDHQQAITLSGELYAKVLETEITESDLEQLNLATLQERSPQTKLIHIHFTTIPADLKGWLDDCFPSSSR